MGAAPAVRAVSSSGHGLAVGALAAEPAVDKAASDHGDQGRLPAGEVRYLPLTVQPYERAIQPKPQEENEQSNEYDIRDIA